MEDVNVVLEDGTNALFTPVISTSPTIIKVVEPNLVGSPKAAVNQVFMDILGYSPSEQEVNLAITEEMSNGVYIFENDAFINWVSHLTEREIFQNTVSAIAGYKIMVGIWPDYLKN